MAERCASSRRCKACSFCRSSCSLDGMRNMIRHTASTPIGQGGLLQQLSRCSQHVSRVRFLQEYDQPLLLQLEAFFKGDGELELSSRGGDVSAFAQTACHGHMVEFATGILATTDLRLSRIVGYGNVYIGVFTPRRQGSRVHTEGEVLLVLSFSGDAQSRLI